MAISIKVSIFVVAAICGNWWQESGINPGVWEGLEEAGWESDKHGYGLGQWTNVGDSHGRLYQLYSFLTENGYELDSGDGQLEFLIQEDYWIADESWGLAYENLQAFLTSDSEDLEALTHAFNDGWEGIHDDSWDTRVENAQRVYEYLLEHADDPNITEWKKGNTYLSEEDRFNNAVMIYRALNGQMAGGGGKRKGLSVAMLGGTRGRRVGYHIGG